MKKSVNIILYLGLSLILSLLIVFAVYEIKELKLASNGLEMYLDMWDRKVIDSSLSGISLEALKTMIDECQSYVISHSFLVSFIFIGILFIAFIFVLVTPNLFRRSTWTNLSEEWAKNKQERSAARVAKAETDKQKRIEELQAELQELKKDE